MRPFSTLISFAPMIILILESSLSSGQKRIIYGEVVQEDELDDWNFLVALFEKKQADDYDFDYYRFFCGGAILSSRQILTAAHCIYASNRSDLAVVPGLDYTRILDGEPDAWDQKGYQVQHIIIHHDFDNNTDINDIAIMTLTEPLNLSEFAYIDLEPASHHPKSKI